MSEAKSSLGHQLWLLKEDLAAVRAERDRAWAVARQILESLRNHRNDHYARYQETYPQLRETNERES